MAKTLDEQYRKLTTEQLKCIVAINGVIDIYKFSTADREIQRRLINGI